MNPILLGMLLLAGQFGTLGGNGQQGYGAVTPPITTQNQCASFGGTATCALATTTGQELAVFTTSSGGGTKITPSGCVTWTQQGSTDGSGNSWFTGPVVSGSSCNVTSTGAGSVYMLVWEVANVIDTVGGQNTAVVSFPGSSPISGATITTSTTNGQMILAVTTSVTGTTETIQSPFTSDASGTVGGLYSFSMGHYVQPTAGAITPAWAVSNLSTIFETGVLALKP